MRQCSTCKLLKPGERTGRLSSRCLSCDNKAGRYTKSSTRNVHLRKMYGADSFTILLLLNKQGGMCAICQMSLTEETACLDHDHKSGKIRGLLCRMCNSALGFFHDDFEIIQRTLEYLRSAQ